MDLTQKQFSDLMNAIPLYRMEQEFARNNLVISRDNMANWTIYSTEHYFSLMYDLLKSILCKQHVVQADETTCNVVRDDRPAGTKSYMHVYRTNEFQKNRQIVLYKYSPGRGHKVAAEFLEGFHGYLETDAFSGYKALEKEQTQITAAFCWAHARRDFSDALKAVGAKNGVPIPQEGSVAAQALAKIAEIYHLEGLLKDLSPEERLRRRQKEVVPLVEAYFTWVKEQNLLQIGSKKTCDGLAYSLNQEKHLKMFLRDGEIPIDNSASERAIRPFTVGRKNWMMLNTPKGAQSSAILYSIAETAKANNLKPYEYFRFLLDEIAKHLYGREYDPNDRTFLNGSAAVVRQVAWHLQEENLKFAGAGFGSSFIFTWRLWLSGYITVRFNFELCRFSFCSKFVKFSKLYSKTALRIPISIGISIGAFKIFLWNGFPLVLWVENEQNPCSKIR